jgi:hypothetical protein
MRRDAARIDDRDQGSSRAWRHSGIIQRELPIDLLVLHSHTAGSKDHQILYLNGTEMDADLNRYDLEHATTAHPRMARKQLQDL